LITFVLFAGLWAIVWLACFSYMTSKWNRSNQFYFREYRSTVEAPLAFAFFCTLIYVRECCYLSSIYPVTVMTVNVLPVSLRARVQILTLPPNVVQISYLLKSHTLVLRT